MRTRRSPRNQDRLFKALFKPPAEPKPEPVVTPCCGNCVSYHDNGRSRGECTSFGMIVRCFTVRPCFRPRAKSESNQER